MENKTTVISTLREFIEWVEQVQKRKAYYRGQANINWYLTPSLFRDPYKGCASENQLLKQASLLAWNELSKYQSYVEKLIFLQHYGLPTRLLDVTFNPFVALFMACCSEYNNDGVVYVGYHCEYDNYDVAEKTIEYVFNNSYTMSKNDLYDFAIGHKLSFEDFCVPIFIYPPLNNPRIEFQQGAFIMAPYAKTNDGTPFNTNDNINLTNFFQRNEAVIPKSKKEKILRQLSILGINEATIYQSITHKLSFIAQEEIWRIKDQDNIVLQ